MCIRDSVNTVYILREVEAPTGYVKASDTEFKLDDYGIVTKISGDAQLVDCLLYTSRCV